MMVISQSPSPEVSYDLGRDLVMRLTSRKFLLCLVVIGLALVGFFTNHLTYDKLTDVVIWAVGIFSGAEGIADAASALRPAPVATTTVVNEPVAQPVAPAILTSDA